MPFAYDVALDEVRLKLARHRLRAFATVTHEANASTEEPLDGRYADLLGEASGYDLPFIEIDENGAAHLFSARRAAAMASCAFE
jgi:hypothetical protein